MPVYLFIAVFFGCATLDTDTEESAQAPVAGADKGLSTVEEPQFPTGFPDVPVPESFEFNRGKSFIYEAGSGTVKVGHLFFSGWPKLDKVITFYQNEMVNKGWKLVQTIEREITTLQYEKEGLVCRVTLEASLGKTIIEIVIGPK
ncbi:MAG: hypothetical protein ACE5G9_06820 [Nitrospinales bacterium]